MDEGPLDSSTIAGLSAMKGTAPASLFILTMTKDKEISWLLQTAVQVESKSPKIESRKRIFSPC